MARPGFYLFLGADRPRQFQRIQELERLLGVEAFDRHSVDGAAVTPSEMLVLCRQQPAASRVRLVVVDQAHRLSSACVEAFHHHADAIAANACVIFLVEGELGSRQALAKMQSLMRVERFPGQSGATAKPFALMESLGRRDVPGALAALQDQLAAGKDPLELLGLVAWQLQRWVMIGRLRDSGYSSQRMMALTGLKSWQMERLQSEIARRSLRSLQRLLERCWRLDVEAKSGRAIPSLALERLVIEVCLGGGG